MQKKAALKDRKSRGTRWYYSNYQPDYLYVTLEDDWCTQVEDAPFEDTMLMIPRGWDPVLREVYGDYMQLPPEVRGFLPIPASRFRYLTADLETTGELKIPV